VVVLSRRIALRPRGCVPGSLTSLTWLLDQASRLPSPCFSSVRRSKNVDRRCVRRSLSERANRCPGTLSNLAVRQVDSETLVP
jgi:hypothetical protein